MSSLGLLAMIKCKINVVSVTTDLPLETGGGGCCDDGCSSGGPVLVIVGVVVGSKWFVFVCMHA